MHITMALNLNIHGFIIIVSLLYIMYFVLEAVNLVHSEYRQKARVRFWRLITKVSGPTKTLHILNAEVVLIT